jgi:hypothetical protein
MRDNQADSGRTQILTVEHQRRAGLGSAARPPRPAAFLINSSHDSAGIGFLTNSSTTQ